MQGVILINSISIQQYFLFLLCDTAHSKAHSEQCSLSKHTILLYQFTWIFSKNPTSTFKFKKGKVDFQDEIRKGKKLQFAIYFMLYHFANMRENNDCQYFNHWHSHLYPFPRKSLWYIQSVERRMKWGPIIISVGVICNSNHKVYCPMSLICY